MGDVTIKVPGLHNVYNSLAAIAVAFELELPFERTSSALEAFTNADRRFQYKGEAAGVTVVDDYGHHPTEIRATLAAAKIGSAGRRIVVLFQPHRYSRTNDLLEEFARSFNNADQLFVADIYAASEDPIEGVSAESLTSAIKSYGHKNANYIGKLEEAATKVFEHLRNGDLFITLGAGPVYRVSEQVLAMLKEKTEGSD